MTMLEAARMGDKVAHTNAFVGFLTGMVLGAALAVGLALLAGATIATGGGALILAGALLAGAGGGALLGMKVGSGHKKGKGDPIATGASTVFIGTDRKMAARATLDAVTCHAPKLIAEGSLTVFIQGGPAARKTDKSECGGTIDEGWETVFIGKEAGRYMPVEDEVPAWMVKAAEWAGIIGAGLGIIGGLIVGGVLVTAFGFVVGKIGGAVGGFVVGGIGEKLFGKDGRLIGDYLGDQLGGFAAGKLTEGANGRLTKIEAAATRGMLAKNPALSTRLARAPGANPLQIAARQNVANGHYRSTRSFTEFSKGYLADNPGANDAALQKAYTGEINSHLSGIDFNKPVEVQRIPAGTELYTYNKPGASDAGSYFTKSATKPTEIGISENVTVSRNGVAETVPKELYTVKTTADVDALVSTAAPKLDTWSVKGVDADGNAASVVAESKGGAEQLNINTARSSENGRTQSDLFESHGNGVLKPTGQTAEHYSDATTNQNSPLKGPSSYDHLPLAGDKHIIGKGTPIEPPGALPPVAEPPSPPMSPPTPPAEPPPGSPSGGGEP